MKERRGEKGGGMRGQEWEGRGVGKGLKRVEKPEKERMAGAKMKWRRREKRRIEFINIKGERY